MWIKSGLLSVSLLALASGAMAQSVNHDQIARKQLPAAGTEAEAHACAAIMSITTVRLSNSEGVSEELSNKVFEVTYYWVSKSGKYKGMEFEAYYKTDGFTNMVKSIDDLDSDIITANAVECISRKGS